MTFDLTDWRDLASHARDAIRKGVTPTEDHWTLLGRACWDWDVREFGAASIDPKRPYGNSDVETDLAELLPHLTPEERVMRHCELGAVVAGLIREHLAQRCEPSPEVTG